MDINETIKSQLEENPIILYMKGSPQAPQCGFSAKTVQAVMACGERFAFVNILDNQELREALKVYSSWPTYPQLYINGELVGGCDIVLGVFIVDDLAFVSLENIGPDTEHEVALQMEQFFFSDGWGKGHIEDIVDKLGGCNHLGVSCLLVVKGIILQHGKQG